MRVGGVIGKGGTIVKILQHETGCDIKILEGSPDSEDRLIIISGPAGVIDVGGPMGMSEYAGARPTVVVTTTTMEVIVPRAIVPSIYGEDGSSLKQIIQISGARITTIEPKPGATEI
ncbi:hypothetical protein IFM89_028232 [Coptis chinensis]|uniref:K Homology domain-containing protein n=1 Tax=Coptis chinensis TaxID=261450 RepID=A0A835IQZ9_9MAGN|nr:hypothetical protein IFM89_028232 [Coptis chinensis]